MYLITSMAVSSTPSLGGQFIGFTQQSTLPYSCRTFVYVMSKLFHEQLQVSSFTHKKIEAEEALRLNDQLPI